MMKVQVALDLSANGVGNFFTLDDTTKGVLDGTTFVLGGDILVDLTDRVRSIQVKRGRNLQLGRFTAGAANITFDNRDRYLDPTYAPTSLTRTNLVTNPSFEVDASGWYGSNTSTVASRITSDSVYGSSCLQIQRITTAGNVGAQVASGSAGAAGTIAVTPGVTYSWSAWVKTTALRSCDVQLAWQTSGGVEFQVDQPTATSVPVGVWTRLSMTATAPATSALVRAVVRILNADINEYGYIDAALFEQSSTLGSYFDGSVFGGTGRVIGQGWNGTANASTSYLTQYVAGTGSPYYGGIVPGKQVQIEHAGFAMYTGNVADWNLDYDISGDSRAEASCTDGLASIANQIVTAGTATAQLSGARIGAYLTDVGWSTTARAISAGQATLGADVIGANENAMTYLTAAVDSEPGALFIGKTGLMTFRDRNDLQSFTSGATFGPSDIPFVGIEVEYGAETLYPTVNVNYWGGTAVAQVTTTDATAASLYGNADLTVDTLLGSNADATTLANYLLGRYANPVYRVKSLTVGLHGITSDQVNTVLALELGDMILLSGWTPNGVGSAISQYLTVEGIEHQADPATHFVTFTLSQTQASFQLDSSDFGVLDDDRLGF